MHAAEAGQGGLQPALDRLFAAVHVVSLSRSAERHPHVRTHFAEIGLTRWSPFDAPVPVIRR